jgi:DNA-binding transcriptional MocR family regulator
VRETIHPRLLRSQSNSSRQYSTISARYVFGTPYSQSSVGDGRGRRTFVSHDVAVALQHANSDWPASSLRARSVWDQVHVETLVDDRLTFNFFTGTPDAALFPPKVGRRLVDEQLGPQPDHGHDGHPAGHAGLRDAIAQHVRMARAVHDPADNVVDREGRLALLAWANRSNAAIVEDDYDSEFRFKGRPIEPLQALDAHGRVIYVGSFSKTLLTSLRLGFIFTPASLRDALHKAKYASDGHTPLHTQAALHEFINQGEYARHVRKMRAIYEERHDVIVGVLLREFGGVLEVLPSAAGLHVTARAPGASIEQMTDILNQARAARIAFHRLSAFAYQHPPEAGIVLGYGAVAVANIELGLRRLRECCAQVVG